MSAESASKSVSKASLKAFFDKEWPDNNLIIESVGGRKARIRMPVTAGDLRPGNTVSGPFMMSAVDTAVYVAIMAELGLVALAVTTNLTINFLRRPRPDVDVIAECRLIKVGKVLVVGEVSLYSDGDDQAIAHAVATYSLPKDSA